MSRPPKPRKCRELHAGDVRDAYSCWPAPRCIISDGAYGVGGFPGDPRTPEDLAAWYAPHVAAWSARADGAATLWFWNTEVGWVALAAFRGRDG